MVLIKRLELLKLGSDARASLYIQLATFPNHYLVLVITDERFKYALITTKVQSESMYGNMVLEDIAWLDFDRIHDAALVRNAQDNTASNPHQGSEELNAAAKRSYG